ncbi:unnamed protein product [Arabidopsis halleri]
MKTVVCFLTILILVSSISCESKKKKVVIVPGSKGKYPDLKLVEGPTTVEDDFCYDCVRRCMRRGRHFMSCKGAKGFVCRCYVPPIRNGD